MWVAGLVLAFAIGISLGMLGAGGSILAIPVFHYVFALEAHAAITSSLIVVALTGVVALVPSARAGAVRWRAGAVLGVGSMLAAFAGGRLGASLPGSLLMATFALVMLAAGASMALRRPVPVAPRDATVHPWRFLAIGAGVGFMTGLLGAGGGFLLVPALVFAARMPIREAVGTSLFVIVMNSTAAIAGAATHAPPRLDLVVPVTALAVLGSIAGVRLGRRLSTAALQRGFGAFVIVLGLVILVTELA